MIYAPDTPAANRFPWRMFLSQTKLSKGPFKEILNDDDFLKTVADAYERKGAMLTDEGMYECVENVYFSMFKTMFVNEDVFWAGALEDGFLAPDDQPSIDGFVFDRFAKGAGQKKRKKFRSTLKKFSKDLYGDSHAWFKDFEDYFRKQNEEHT